MKTFCGVTDLILVDPKSPVEVGQLLRKEDLNPIQMYLLKASVDST